MNFKDLFSGALLAALFIVVASTPTNIGATSSYANVSNSRYSVEVHPNDDFDHQVKVRLDSIFNYSIVLDKQSDIIKHYKNVNKQQSRY